MDKQRDSRGNRSIADSFCVNVGKFIVKCTMSHNLCHARI